ncbi:MAG: glycoside hydrolase family 3 C-terminal domain-containing protein [Bacteroidota bacterium]
MKVVKIILIALVTLILLVGLTAFFGWRFVNKTYLDFEGDYPEKRELEQRTIDGHTFWDRNGNNALDVYEDDRQPIEKRVANLLSLMTIEEKIHLLKGSGIASAAGLLEAGEGIPGAVGTIVPTPRLGIPTVYLSDGPAGLRIQPTRPGEERTYYCTAFPIATMLASTWNEALVQEVGRSMGKEALEYGLDVILGPGANIHRHPFCGRNFEYYSEDPVLTGNIGAAMVNGIESNGIGTSVKHYVANNQETDRFLNNTIVSERALREIYLKGFEIIIQKSQPWTVMSSYNKINGTYASENQYLLTDVLRDDLQFEGLVMSDWFAGSDAAAQIKAGNDLLEPGTKKQWDELIEAHESGRLTVEDIDLAAGRILTLVFRSHKMKNEAFGNNPDLKAHAKVTRQSAAEGIVLLKNRGALPLRPKANVALIGVTSYEFIAGGTGSGDVSEAYTISLEEGLTNANLTINEVAKNAFDAHKAANIESFNKPEGLEAMFTPYQPPELILDEATLKQIALDADVGIVTIGRNSGEGGDRVEKDDFLLSEMERQMIKRSCEAFQEQGKKVVVVLNIGGVIETASWDSLPDAVVLAWQGGQEGGNSVADVLSGKVNPSGKLPMTFPIHLKDHAANANFPLEGVSINVTDMITGVISGPKEKPESEKIKNRDYTEYEEGIYVGYRHFDKKGIDVAYPFGYGLSYTRFAFSDVDIQLRNDSIHMAVNVQNTGEVAGKQVVQLYVSKPQSKVDRPLQELKGFSKTALLNPGASEVIKIVMPVADLQYWDESKNGWMLEEGTYEIKVATDSRDTKFTETIEIGGSESLVNQ